MWHRIITNAKICQQCNDFSFLSFFSFIYFLNLLLVDIVFDVLGLYVISVFPVLWFVWFFCFFFNEASVECGYGFWFYCAFLVLQMLLMPFHNELFRSFHTQLLQACFTYYPLWRYFGELLKSIIFHIFFSVLHIATWKVGCYEAQIHVLQKYL